MNTGASLAVTGASSQIGVFLLPLLAAAGHPVTALSRRAPAEPLAVGDGVRWQRDLAGPDEVTGLLSCGPLDLALSLVERCAGLGKVVAFGTTSTETKAASPDPAERATVAAIAAAEARLRVLCGERGIDLVLVRPTLVYGCGLDKSLARLLRLGNRSGFIPLSNRADGLRQPVHAADLAGLAARALRTETGRFLEGPAPGGSTLSYRAMVERVARCGRRRIRPLPLPAPLLVGLLRTGQRAGLLEGANPEMVRRQARDLVFDDCVFRDRLGWDPRPFEPTPADFRVPPEAARYQLPATQP
jgi:nucleoside-diphosphate-sugar epimerase